VFKKGGSMRSLFAAVISALVIGALLLGMCGCGGESAEKKPMEKPEKEVVVTKTSSVEGRWVGGSGTGSQGWAIEFSGSTVNIVTPDKDIWYKGTFALNETAEPREMDMTFTSASPKKYVGKTSLAIYEIDGKTMKVASCEPGSGNRPAEFKPTGGVVVLTLTRE
jgi:uncharacterized protein (TIGR03067 family)